MDALHGEGEIKRSPERKQGLDVAKWLDLVKRGVELVTSRELKEQVALAKELGEKSQMLLIDGARQLAHLLCQHGSFGTSGLSSVTQSSPDPIAANLCQLTQYRNRYCNDALYQLEKLLLTYQYFPNVIGDRFSVLMGMSEILPTSVKHGDYVTIHDLCADDPSDEARTQNDWKLGQVKKIQFVGYTCSQLQLSYKNLSTEKSESRKGYFIHDSGCTITSLPQPDGSRVQWQSTIRFFRPSEGTYGSFNLPGSDELPNRYMISQVYD